MADRFYLERFHSGQRSGFTRALVLGHLFEQLMRAEHGVGQRLFEQKRWQIAGQQKAQNYD